MIIILDGNDGVGKSTLFAALKSRGYDVIDRGLPTKMTDNPALRPGPEHAGEVYCILDVPVEVSRHRLAAAGKDLNEKYHTIEDLTHYRRRYQEVAEILGVPLIDSSGTQEETLAKVETYLESIE
jgi:thymidylate kinase